MSGYTGKYDKSRTVEIRGVPFLLIPLSFVLIELFGSWFLLPEGESGTFPLAFGLLWSGAISGVLFLLPSLAARVIYGITYFLSAVYAGVQTGYYLLFSGMLWLSDFRYAAEGADYAANWDYYEKMCESSSSLSFAPHSICAADNGRMLSAYNYLIETSYIDVYDIHHCGWQGVHSGCLVGAWMAMFRGVAGIVCREDKIEVNPHMMPWWDSVSFNFLYHGHKITVKMTNETYTLTTDSDKEIKVVFRGKELSLSKANAVNEKM